MASPKSVQRSRQLRRKTYESRALSQDEKSAQRLGGTQPIELVLWIGSEKDQDRTRREPAKRSAEEQQLAPRPPLHPRRPFLTAMNALIVHPAPFKSPPPPPHKAGRGGEVLTVNRKPWIRRSRPCRKNRLHQGKLTCGQFGNSRNSHERSGAPAPGCGQGAHRGARSGEKP